MKVTKSIIVKGNLRNGKLVYTCYPINEFGQGKWKLAIQSIVFDSTETISTTCLITSNFVTSKRRAPDGDINSYQQPLNTFHLKTTSTAIRGIFRFGKICFFYDFA